MASQLPANLPGATPQQNRRNVALGFKPRVTQRQKLFLKHLSFGETLGQAAIHSGFSEKNAGQVGYQLFKHLEAKFPQILEKMGLTDSSIVDKYLRPALEANETKFWADKGEVIDSREVIAWDTRMKALDMLFRLKGSYASEKIEHTGKIEHVLTPVETSQALNSIHRIQALESSCETPLEAEIVDEETT